MQRTLLSPGKLQSESLAAVNGSPIKSNRLFATDRTTKLQFLIDTGADLCVYPHTLLSGFTERANYTLMAENASTINTYGCDALTLNFGLRREFKWRFVVADTTKPIIGADFLVHFSLLPELKRGLLLDALTGLKMSGRVLKWSIISEIKIISIYKSFWSDLLTEFPNITKPESICKATKHIVTTPRTPVSNRPRRLTSDKLKIAKAEFHKMIELGIARTSKSPWSSPLHLVPKKSGDLNTATV